MSKYSSKISLLAAGLAIVMAAPSAFAITLTADSAATKVAAIDVKDATTVVAMGAFDISVANTDLIIGRTTGFSVRIDLPTGAKFATDMTAVGAKPTIGAALGGGGTPWTASVAAGGTTNDGYVVYSVQPAGGSTGVVNGSALSWAADVITLKGVANLATSGNSVSATVTFADPNTAATILTPKSAVVATSDDALNFSIDTSSLIGAASTTKIDVGAVTGFPGKTRFSPNGSLSNTGGEQFFAPGQIKVGVKAGVKSLGASGTAFTWVNTDTGTVTLTGNFNAFTTANSGKALLVLHNACTSTGPTVQATGTVTSTAITFTDVTYDKLADMDICLITDGAHVIDATSIAATATVKRTASGKTNNGTGTALSLAYNGANAKVDHFNPASNSTVQSYLRVTNTSAAAGKLSIKLTCDDGTSPGTAVINSLAAGKSILIESGNLENGTGPVNVGSGSCSTGKSRLDLTGEFGTMAVQNFMRNIMSSGVVNVNTNNQN